jgi:hypothetical protein
MSSPRLNLEYRDSLRAQLVSAAQSIVDGRLGIVEGTRTMIGLAFKLEVQNDEPFLYFQGLDSRTDHFPIGVVREQWSRSALAREDALRESIEVSVKPQVLSHCQTIVRMFGSHDV